MERSITELASRLEERLALLTEQIFPTFETEGTFDGGLEKGEGVLSGADAVSAMLNGVSAWPVVLTERTGRGAETGESSNAGERSITQNIYIRDNDPSPYRTARAIRRESEAMLRI